MPKLLKTPFAVDAAEGFRTDIQESTGAAPNSATYQVGFPPVTMQSIASNGMPPKGSDLNGVLYDITDNFVFLTQGGGYGFDAAYATSIGGYPLNARLRLTNGDIVKSTVANNINNPNVDMTGWVLVNSDSQITTWSGRTQESKNKDSIHVLDFKQGKTDQEAIQDAVNYCIENNRTLDWDGANLTSTANIDNFWSVQHVGFGSIKRGSNVFKFVTKDLDKTTLYVDSTGNDSNDGLSVSEPMRSLSRVKYILSQTTPEMRGGSWTFKFAAGTYADSTNFPSLPKFQRAITFQGEGSRRAPTVIFDGALATYQTAGMYFTNDCNIVLDLLKFQNFISGYGVLAEHRCTIEYNNCVAQNCNIGFSAGYSSFARATGSDAIDCLNAGFRIASNACASYKPNTNNIADANRAIRCGYGFVATRLSYGHFDYNIIEDCTYAGMLIEINSRMALFANEFKRNPVAIRTWSNGFFSIDTTNPNNFFVGTADANAMTYDMKASGGIVNLQGQVGTSMSSVYKNLTTVTNTGSAAAINVHGTLFTAWAGWFVSSTKRMKVKVIGTVTTTDSTISLQVRLAGTALSTISIPANQANQLFMFECETFAPSATTQKNFSKLIVGSQVLIASKPTTIDMSVSDRPLTLYTDADGTAATTSSITIESVEVEICG